MKPLKINAKISNFSDTKLFSRRHSRPYRPPHQSLFYWLYLYSQCHKIYMGKFKTSLKDHWIYYCSIWQQLIAFRLFSYKSKCLFRAPVSMLGAHICLFAYIYTWLFRRPPILRQDLKACVQTASLGTYIGNTCFEGELKINN